MENVALLDGTRKISKLLQYNSEEKILFDDICTVLSKITSSGCRVLSAKGKVLGRADRKGSDPMADLGDHVGEIIDPKLNERLLEVLSTKENVNIQTLGLKSLVCDDLKAIITPIIICGERLGTLFLFRNNKEYDIEDIILCEYSTSVIGLEILRSETEEESKEKRKVSAARAAVSTLSASELEALEYVFEEMNGMEGVLVASKIADRVGITRSVIVNALRKLESAEVITSKSSGMKGTYIRILNDSVFTELEHLKKNK